MIKALNQRKQIMKTAKVFLKPKKSKFGKRHNLPRYVDIILRKDKEIFWLFFSKEIFFSINAFELKNSISRKYHHKNPKFYYSDTEWVKLNTNLKKKKKEIMKKNLNIFAQNYQDWPNNFNRRPLNLESVHIMSEAPMAVPYYVVLIWTWPYK